MTVNAANPATACRSAAADLVFNPHLAETDIAGFCFNQRTVGGVQFNHRHEIRVFGPAVPDFQRSGVV